MTLLAFGGAFGLLLVTTLAPDMEGVLLGAHDTRIRRVGVLTVALEAAFGIILSRRGVMTDGAIGSFGVGLVRKNYGWFFSLSLVDGDNIRRTAMGDRDQGHRTENNSEKGENDNCFSFHLGSSLISSPPGMIKNKSEFLSHTCER